MGWFKGIISGWVDVVLGHAWDAAIDGEDGQNHTNFITNALNLKSLKHSFGNTIMALTLILYNKSID